MPELLLQRDFDGLTIELLIEPRDVWVGLYWTRSGDWVHFYLCVVPCFPVHVLRFDPR